MTISRLFGAGAAAVLLAAGASAAEPTDLSAPRCIRVTQIRSTSAPDDRTIVFWMKDGTKLSNQLTGPCVGLTVSGFVYAPDTSELVCATEQRIRLLQTHAICQLGAFSRIPSP
jgi:hypothetical protein